VVAFARFNALPPTGDPEVELRADDVIDVTVRCVDCARGFGAGDTCPDRLGHLPSFEVLTAKVNISPRGFAYADRVGAALDEYALHMGLTLDRERLIVMQHTLLATQAVQMMASRVELGSPRFGDAMVGTLGALLYVIGRRIEESVVE
jgi:hypothetical protein